MFLFRKTKFGWTVLLLGGICSLLWAYQSLTNQDILRMVEEGLGAEEIQKRIARSQCDFDTGATAILELTSKGVPEAVIRAMVEKSSPRAQRTGPAALRTSEPARRDEPTGVPVEPGAYFRQQGRMVSLPREPVEWKGGGIWKSVTSAGLRRGGDKGVVQGEESRSSLQTGAEIHIRCNTGVQAGQFWVVEMQSRKGHREFRLKKARKASSFETAELGEGVYLLHLSGLKPGQYGLLPPDPDDPDSPLDEVYTFQVTR